LLRRCAPRNDVIITTSRAFVFQVTLKALLAGLIFGGKEIGVCGTPEGIR
jgi:hypothetical protein